jgi:nickel superoxide dismutase
MSIKTLLPVVLILAGLLVASTAGAHCEIPCGIYDDRLRMGLIAEHIATVEKSMRRILALEAENPVLSNQLVRWIANKDEHAGKIQEIVWQYFMTQRIKIDAEKYTQKIAVLHRMLISAMRCKQTTDVSHTTTLRKLLETFESLYFGPSPE